MKFSFSSSDLSIYNTDRNFILTLFNHITEYSWITFNNFMNTFMFSVKPDPIEDKPENTDKTMQLLGNNKLGEWIGRFLFTIIQAFKTVIPNAIPIPFNFNSVIIYIYLFAKQTCNSVNFYINDLLCQLWLLNYCIW